MEAHDLILTDGAVISATTFGAGRGGNVTVRATGNITLSGSTLGGSRAGGILAGTVSAGDAGTIIVESHDLTLTDGAQISADTFGTGRGGSVTVRATGNLTLSGAS